MRKKVAVVRMSTSKAPNQMPTPAEMMKEVAELRRQVGSLQANAAATTMAGRTGYKVVKPELFDGTRSKLQFFLTQTGLYLMFHQQTLPEEKDKVLAVANLLTGSTFDWFELRMRNFLEKSSDSQDSDTV